MITSSSIRFKTLFTLILFTGFGIIFASNSKHPRQSIYTCSIMPDGSTKIDIPDNSDIYTDISPSYLNTLNNSAISFDLRVRSDMQMSSIWIFQPQGHLIFVSDDSEEYTFDLPPNKYEFITYIRKSMHQFIFIYKKDIIVTSGNSTTVNISVNEANISSEFKFYREDYKLLRINSFILWFMLDWDKNLGVGFNHYNLDSTSFILQYNDLPDYFENSWLVKGKQLWNNNNFYLINNYFLESADDTIVSNNPENFCYADVTYHFPDSIESKNLEIKVANQAPSGNYPFNDPINTLPFQYRIFQDTSADFTLKQSRFSQSVNVTSLFGLELQTCEWRLGENNAIGYLSPDEYSNPIRMSESKKLDIGVTPVYWAGRFFNARDSIKFWVKYGFSKRNQLFLSMTNDIIIHPYVKLIIQSNDLGLYTNKLIYPVFESEVAWAGYRESDLSFYVDENQYYTINLHYSHSEVAKHKAKSIANVSFNLSRADKNPPFMRSFQIMSDQKITNNLENGYNNIIRINAQDDNMLSDVQIFYSKYNDSTWVNLSDEYAPPYYTFTIPDLEDGYYSLKTYLADSSQNWIENVMEPAFHVGNLSKIEQSDNLQHPEEIYLSEGYPNPFNSTIHFKYLLPDNTNEKVDISIFNILGKKILTLYSGYQSSGQYHVSWEGIDSNNQPLASGIYFINMHLKGSNLVRKILLLK